MGAVALVVVALTACDTWLAGSPLLVVAPDRSVSVPLACAAEAGSCSGSAIVRLGDLESAPVPFEVAIGGVGAVAISLTESQHAVVPVEGFVEATLIVDQDAPQDYGPVSQQLALRRAGPATATVTVGVGGAVLGNHASYDPMLSGDGRFIAYHSAASNLVEGDTNGTTDVFVFDRVSSTTTMVSVDSDGTQANGSSKISAISRDGRFATFESTASNLVPGVTGRNDFVHDRVTGATRLADPPSPPLPGLPAFLSMSADGRYGLFLSADPGLVPDDTNGRNDVFVHDLVSGTTTRVSVASDGSQATNHSWDAAMTPDGRTITFRSDANNLVPGDTNGAADIFVHELATGVTTRVSVATGGGQGESGGYVYRTTSDPGISDDGRFVSFVSTARDLVPNDDCCSRDVFVHDRATATTIRASVSTAGVAAPADASPASGATISSDGRSVAFVTSALELSALPNPTHSQQVFVHDLDWSP